MNTFNEELERSSQDGSEWQFGAIETDLAQVPLEQRMVYLPIGVLQFNNVMDSNGCASRAILNILESKLTYMIREGIMHPAIVEWMYNNGYIVFD